MAKNCFTCRVNGSGMCEGTCGLCGELCPGVGDNCKKKGCKGKIRRYGRSFRDYTAICDICNAVHYL